jgi:hypothetical protein
MARGYRHKFAHLLITFLLLLCCNLSRAEVFPWPLSGLALAKDEAVSISCVNDLKQIGLASNMYLQDNGNYPTTFSAITNLCPTPDIFFCPANGAHVSPLSWNAVNWSQVDYELFPGASENDPTSILCKCKVHNNVCYSDGSVIKQGGFRSGWPAIIANALDQYATPGSTVFLEFKINASAAQPLFFQWRREYPNFSTNVIFVADPNYPGGGYYRTNVTTTFTSQNLTAQTNRTYAISNIQTNQTGYYSLAITNSKGVVISQPVQVHVDSNVSFIVTNDVWLAQRCISNLRQIGLFARIWSGQHDDRAVTDFIQMTNYDGSPIFGWPPVLYCPADFSRSAPSNWNAFDFTKTSYALNSNIISSSSWADLTSTLFCQCKVHHFYVAMDGSGVYTIGGPMFLEQPVDQTIPLRSNAVFVASAMGIPPLKYAWYKDGQLLTTFTNSSLVCSNVKADQIGIYQVAVSDSQGSVTSNPARLMLRSSSLVYSSPITQWQRTIGGSGNDTLICLDKTSDGGLILGGFSDSSVSGNKTAPNYGLVDYWLIKLDSLGNKQWDKSFGGTNHDRLSCSRQTGDGGFILGGSSNSGASGNRSSAAYGGYDLWLVKLDASGNKIWEKSFGGTNDDICQSIQQTQDGGYLVGGYSASGPSGSKSASGYGSSDYWVIKLNGSGNKLWEKTFGGEAEEKMTMAAQVADGGYILAGYSKSGVSGNKSKSNIITNAFVIPGEDTEYGQDYWVVKLDGNGNKLWESVIGTQESETLYDLQMTADGGLLIGGQSLSGTSLYKSADGSDWLVKLDKDGKKLWDRSYANQWGNSVCSVLNTVEGGYVLLNDAMGCAVQRVDSNLNKVWEQSFAGTLSQPFCKILQAADGGYIVGGNFGNDFRIIKLSADCPLTSPPTITTQPQSLNVGAGGNSTFTVLASGTGPVSFQWRFNGLSIIGATASSLTISNTQSANAGTYDVVAFNSAGSVISSNAILTVNNLPVLQNGPQNVSAIVGTSVSFSITVTGGLPLYYQWYFKGSPILGATSTSYGIPNVQTNHAGNYSITVSNSWGVITGSALLTVLVPPAIITQPKTQVVVAGSNATVLVVATGTAPLAYQWRLNGNALQGATGSSLVLSNFSGVQVGSYSAVVSNTAGVMISQSASLSLRLPAILRFSEVNMTGSNCWLKLSGETNTPFLVESSTNLVSWLPVTVLYTSNFTASFLDPQSSISGKRFYRSRMVSAQRVCDLNSVPSGTSALFLEPSASGSTSSFIDTTYANFLMVTNASPLGSEEPKVLIASWKFIATSNAWLRLTTFNANMCPNPTLGFNQALRLNVYCDQSIYLAMGVRETSSSAMTGQDGGTIDNIEWIGGITDNLRTPPKGRLISSQKWTTVTFFVPYEPIQGMTGNGILESTTGKGVFEQLTIVPFNGSGPYTLYLDNFQIVNLD